MKILIARSSENQTIGGAELSARDQAIVLKDLGHEPILATNNLKIRQMLDSKDIETRKSFYLQRFTPPLRYLYFWGLFPAKLVLDLWTVLTLQPDVINPHTREDQISYTLSKSIHRKPVVWKDPGDMIFVLGRKQGLLGSIYKSLYMYAARRADHIYVLNEDHLDLLAESIGRRNRLSAIPSSILYQDYSPAEKTDHDDPLTFGSLCRLSAEKNIAALVEAYLEISDSLPDSRLLVVGDGPERASLEELADNNPQIEFVGNQTDTSKYLNQIDIFVHPALHEGWGRSIKEAMYFGKAVIGTDVGGIAKQISDGENGLLVSPAEDGVLAEAMLDLANNPKKRRRLAQNARQKAIDDGDFADIVEKQLVPIYQSAANSK